MNPRRDRSERNSAEKDPAPERRRFFRHAAAMGAAAALGLVSRRTPTAPTEAAGEPPPAGYRPTDHIRKYYEKASLI